MRKHKLFIGMESTNLLEFESPCCHVGLSLEPLCRIACGGCGGTIRASEAIWIGHPRKPAHVSEALRRLKESL